jgi:hypothetical protein
MADEKTTLTNPYRHSVLVCLAIIVLGIIMIFLPGITGMDGFKGGFALAFFGAFVVVVGIISVLVVGRFDRIAARILKKENIIAHWTYSAEDWKQYTEEEHAADKTDKRHLFILVAIISIIVGIIVLIIFPDDLLLIIYIVLGIIAMIGLTAYLSAAAPYRWNKKHPGEVYIARDGAYLNRQLHIWNGMGTRLSNASYEEGNLSLPRIKIEYSSPSLTMGNYYTARIPVPRGQEETAKEIVAQIKASQLKE